MVLERDGVCRNSHLSPKGHARHTRHADHTTTNLQVKAPSADLSGSLPADPRRWTVDQQPSELAQILTRLPRPATAVDAAMSAHAAHRALRDPGDERVQGPEYLPATTPMSSVSATIAP